VGKLNDEPLEINISRFGKTSLTKIYQRTIGKE
jgi:hypothetical protein